MNECPKTKNKFVKRKNKKVKKKVLNTTFTEFDNDLGDSSDSDEDDRVTNFTTFMASHTSSVGSDTDSLSEDEYIGEDNI